MIILRDKKTKDAVLVKDLLEVLGGASYGYKISITRNNVELKVFKVNYESFKEIVGKILSIEGVRGVLIQSELITSADQIAKK